MILVKSDFSGWFLDIQNPARAHSVTQCARDVSLKKTQSEVRRRHLKPPIGGLTGSNFKVSVESKFMNPAGNFFEP